MTLLMARHHHDAMATKKESEDANDCLTDVGFLFEGAKVSTLKHFEWSRGAEAPKICVALSVVDEDPGALQSGHYLWPAAPALVQYLLEEDDSAVSVVELGAGCALVSLAALQLFADSLKCIVVTDHDPGTLKRARENYESTLKEVKDNRKQDLVKEVSSVPILFESLSWGEEHGAKILLETLHSTIGTTKQFDLVLGSDLIYCIDVIEPLLSTVSFLLNKSEESKFLLSQSFLFDDKTEEAIDTTCEKLGLQHSVLLDTLDQDRGIRIQKYQWS